MKKTLATVLATSMMLSAAVTAFAAPVYENEKDEILKNTVGGFSGGATHFTVDLTQKEGKVEIPFDLGENASYYSVDIDITDGKKQLNAEFNKAKGLVVLRPDVDVKVIEPQDFEIKLEVLDRKDRDTIADGFTISGQISYDEMQEVETGSRYNNRHGVLYDFGEGAKDVEVNVGHDMVLNFDKTARGIYNLDISTDGNESIDYMFSAHDLSYLNFVSKPKFTNAVKVTLNASEELYLYEYVNGKLQKIPGVQFDENSGYIFETKQLATYILADMPLTEGVVNESANTVRPEGGNSGNGNSGSGNSSGGTPSKNNPTTGAYDMGGLLGAIAALSLAGASVIVVRKVRR